MADSAPPRLTYLRIQNYRALRDLELRDLSSLTVLVGPNGSGKSTVLDALAFLGECANGRLQEAWQSRKQKYGAVKSIGGEGEAVKFEVRMDNILVDGELIYQLEVDSFENAAITQFEGMFFKSASGPSEPLILYASQRIPDPSDKYALQTKLVATFVQEQTETVSLGMPDDEIILDAANGDGFARMFFSAVKDQQESSSSKNHLAELPRILRNLLTSYRYIHFTDSHTQGSALGEMPQLTTTGDNLRNVLFYLWNHQREAFDDLLEELKRRVPRLADVEVKATEDQRILLYFRDAPFPTRIPDRAASDGTLRLLAYLTLLREPKTAGMLGIEEPEGELHPKLLYELAEAFEQASFRTQLFVATHSPEFLNALSPEQVWVLERAPDGYTRATRTADIPYIKAEMEEGSMLGYIWRKGGFGIGDPLYPSK